MKNSKRGTFRSPQEMFNEGCKMMLGGRKPLSQLDYIILVNFFAVNVHRTVALTAVPFLCSLYEFPLNKEGIISIVQQQLDHQE